MDKKAFTLTLAAALVVTAIGVSINQSQQGSADLDNPLLLAGLADGAASLAQIKIEASGNKLIVDSKKQQDKWVIDNLGAYTADTAQLASLINALKDAHKVEAKTAKPALFHHLGLRDISDPQSQAVLVSLSGGGKTYQLLVGNNAKSGKGQYVRLMGDNQTWLIDQQITKPEKAEDWINTKLFDFTLADVQSVSLSGKHSYVLTKADKTAQAFELGSIPQTHKLKYDSILDALPRSIATLSFEQLMPVADWQTSIAADSQTLDVQLFDETQVKLILASVADKYYAHIKGDNALWNNWVYEISEYSYNQLVKDKVAFFDVIENDK